jgi:hypothetical protein
LSRLLAINPEKNRSHWQKLINDLAEAQSTLTHPQHKSNYDNRLRGISTPPVESSPAAAPASNAPAYPAAPYQAQPYQAQPYQAQPAAPPQQPPYNPNQGLRPTCLWSASVRSATATSSAGATIRTTGVWTSSFWPSPVCPACGRSCLWATCVWSTDAGSAGIWSTVGSSILRSTAVWGTILQFGAGLRCGSCGESVCPSEHAQPHGPVSRCACVWLASCW